MFPCSVYLMALFYHFFNQAILSFVGLQFLSPPLLSQTRKGDWRRFLFTIYAGLFAISFLFLLIGYLISFGSLGILPETLNTLGALNVCSIKNSFRVRPFLSLSLSLLLNNLVFYRFSLFLSRSLTIVIHCRFTDSFWRLF